MKKTWPLLLFPMLLLFASCAEASDFLYELHSDGAYITAYTGGEDEIPIPESIDGHQVTGIQSLSLVEEAGDGPPMPFFGLFAGKISPVKGTGNTPRSVTVPGTVKTIAAGAFANCEGLEKIVLAEGVETIGDAAFVLAVNLAEIAFPESLVSIGDSAFYGTKWLDRNVEEEGWLIVNGTLIAAAVEGEVTVPATVTAIAGDAFAPFYAAAVSVVLPDTVTSIGHSAFARNQSLEKIVIPASVAAIGDYAFYECGALSEIVIAGNVNRFGFQTFTGTPWLGAQQEKNPLVILNGVVIDASMAQGNVEIPATATVIGPGAFTGAFGVSAVAIPDSIVSIGQSAFFGSHVRDLLLPDSAVEIATDAFFSCDDLQSARFPASRWDVAAYEGYSFFAKSAAVAEDDVADPRTVYFRQTGLYLRDDKGEERRVIEPVLLGDVPFTCSHFSGEAVEIAFSYYAPDFSSIHVVQGVYDLVEDRFEAKSDTAYPAPAQDFDGR